MEDDLEKLTKKIGTFDNYDSNNKDNYPVEISNCFIYK